ncbi:MAG: ATP-dependent DNA helicase RecG [Oscillospiraceae bacterium]|nr:ATP-dependent DNA helicase RecG [Oscillospiraceae bacterium]
MSELQFLKGVGPQRVRLFEKLGLHTPRDLLNHFPRGYQDRRAIVALEDGEDSSLVCIRGKVIKPLQGKHLGQNRSVFSTRVTDGTGFCALSFFNAPYVNQSLRIGGEYIFFGRLVKGQYGWEMTNPLFETEGTNRTTGRIVPIYPLTAGLTSAFFGNCVEQILDDELAQMTEMLPEMVRSAAQICHIDFAYRHIHAPEDEKTLAIARRRLVFEELLLLALGLQRLRVGQAVENGVPMAEGDLAEFLRRLPFTLTDDQRKAIDEALSDMRSGKAMHRLLQGDVGSGKTAVAAALASIATANNWQTALMAPTEILATQHVESLAALLPNKNIVLCTGQLSAKARRVAQEAMRDGQADIVVGTHALLSDSTEFAKLGLVITDEQHRFGVDQRMTLTGKTEQMPHVLVMSATPIPRTLALILHGDMDVSVIKQMPSSRKRVQTFVVEERKRCDMYAFIRKQIAEGRQAYIVCPRVEYDEFAESQKKSAVALAKELQSGVFRDLRVGVLHGKSKDKDKVMATFARGELDILVATTVIEVGINVPNASVMVVENADNFGLSQLHQLRGRVGRGEWQSYCLLMDSGGEVSRERLDILAKTSDGFELAEADLRLRGPGSFFGVAQSGFGALKVADLSTDADVYAQARQSARAILEVDPDLSENAALRQAVEALMAHL